ncbi:E3 ubiquitin-protein ligase TRIM21-like [Engraulis encrasicolus]|uniref:E3 ubiquitin-protein ligase TRIM21-like n=1 Tax=Engraulis encrasicolus TaxID=184585 RepID=UPI002FD02A4B
MSEDIELQDMSEDRQQGEENIYANLSSSTPPKKAGPCSSPIVRYRCALVFLGVLCALLAIIIRVMWLNQIHTEDNHQQTCENFTEVTSYDNNREIATYCSILSREKSQLETNYNALSREKSQLETNYNTLSREKSQLQTNYNALSTEKSQLETNYNALSREKSQLQTNYNTLSTEKSQLETNYNALSREKSQLETNYNTLSSEKSQLETNYNALSREKSQLETNYNALSRKKSQLETNYNALSREKSQLETNYNALSREKSQLETNYNALSREKSQLETNYCALNCDKLQTMDVTLDPDTAHQHLILTADGKQVQHGDTSQNRPDNPKRFDPVIVVLGKQGFSSGKFYYEVQVSGKTKWSLGVAIESVNRKGSSTNGYWKIWLRDSQYKASAVTLSLTEKPERVGVFVDYGAGLVSFYDADRWSLIYSYKGAPFREKIYPYFSPGLNDNGQNSAPLVITPVPCVK